MSLAAFFPSEKGPDIFLQNLVFLDVTEVFQGQSLQLYESQKAWCKKSPISIEGAIEKWVTAAPDSAAAGITQQHFA